MGNRAKPIISVDNRAIGTSVDELSYALRLHSHSFQTCNSRLRANDGLSGSNCTQRPAIPPGFGRIEASGVSWVSSESRLRKRPLTRSRRGNPWRITAPPSWPYLPIGPCYVLALISIAPGLALLLQRYFSVRGALFLTRSRLRFPSHVYYRCEVIYGY
jgi:hypothetical protein